MTAPSYSEDRSGPHDAPIASCVDILLGHYQLPWRAADLTGGTGGALPDLAAAADALERAGFAPRLLPGDLRRLKADALPAIVRLANRAAFVLLAIYQDGRLDILEPGDHAIGQSTLGHCEGIGVAEILSAPRAADRARSQPATFDWFWTVVRRHRRLYGEAALCAVLVNICAVSIPLFTLALYDRIIPNGAMASLWALAIGIVLVIAFQSILSFLRGMLLEEAGGRVDARLGDQFVWRLLGIQLTARPKSAGALAAQLRDMESARETVTTNAVVAAIDAVFALIFVAIIYALAGAVALVSLASILLIVATGALFTRRLGDVSHRYQETNAARAAHISETAASLEAIKTLGAESWRLRAWSDVNATALAAGRKLRASSQVNAAVMSSLQQLHTILLLVVGTYEILHGAISMGGLIAASLLSSRAVASASGLANVLGRARQAQASRETLDAIMAAPLEARRGSLSAAQIVARGGVEFADVEFAYPGAHHPALTQISFKLAPGECAALVGRGGAGKSTIARLVAGLYEPARGAVSVGGVDVRQIPRIDLRRALGYVPQDPDIFQGTLYENLIVGAEAVDRDAVLAAAQTTGLHDFAAAHPDGYELAIEERGRNLPGGVRQAVSLTRALLLNPSIIVLDEPTNAMDTFAEQQLVQRLKPICASGKTVLVITHRAAVLDLATRVIVLDGGKIVSDGPRDIVLAPRAPTPASGLRQMQPAHAA